jgi:hypothetical protein
MIGFILAIFNLSQFFLLNLINMLPNFLAYKIQIYLDLLKLGEHSEISIINIYYCFLLFSIYIFYFLLIKNKIKIKSNYDIIFVKILSISLFTFYFFSNIPVFAYRISEFLNVVVIVFFTNLILYFNQKNLIFYIMILFLFYMFYRSITLLNLQI